LNYGHKDNWVTFPIDDVPVNIMLLFNKIAGVWRRGRKWNDTEIRKKYTNTLVS